MQVPVQVFETRIIIGEPAVSSRVTAQHQSEICLGIFPEEKQQRPADLLIVVTGHEMAPKPTDMSAMSTPGAASH